MFKRLYNLGYIGYMFLLVLSLIFFKERTIFSDMAFHLFAILTDDAFAIQNFRYGAVATQVFPLIGGRLSLSLESIVMLYSAAFIIYYTLCYFVCGTVFKNYKLALVLLLSSFIFVTDTFYWIQSELPQGLAFALVFFAFLITQKPDNMKALSMAMMFFSIVTIVFFHPLLIFSFIFLISFFALRNEQIIDKKLMLASFIFYILIFLLKRYVFKASYDNNAMDALANFKNTNYIFLYSNKQFLLNCLTKYYWIPIVFVVIFPLYVFRREWGKAALFSFFVIGYLMLVNVSYPNTYVKDFYMENLYLPLGIFLVLPIVYDVLPLLGNWKYLQYGVLITFIVTGGARMYLAHEPYTAKLNWERSILNQYAAGKVFIPEEKVPKEILLTSWSTPYEFWLLSTIERGTTASIVVLEHKENQEWSVNRQKAFFTVWGMYPYENLPSRYFKFKDTSTVYQILR